MENENLEMETPETKGEGTPETPEAEKPEEEKSKELQSAIAQKEHFRKKYEELKASKDKSEPQIGTPKPFDPMETVKISKVLSKYNDEESEFILQRAGSVSFDAIKKAEEDKWTQIAIQGMRVKVAGENKVPAPGSSSPFSSSEKSPEEIGKMTPEEHRKYEEKIVKERRGQGI